MKILTISMLVLLMYWVSGCNNTAHKFGGLLQGVGDDIQVMAQNGNVVE